MSPSFFSSPDALSGLRGAVAAGVGDEGEEGGGNRGVGTAIRGDQWRA